MKKSYALALIALVLLGCEKNPLPAPSLFPSNTINYSLIRQSTFGHEKLYPVGEVILSFDTMAQSMKIMGRQDSVFFTHGVYPYRIKDSSYLIRHPREIGKWLTVTRTYLRLPTLAYYDIIYYRDSTQIRLISDYVSGIADEEDHWTFTLL